MSTALARRFVFGARIACIVLAFVAPFVFPWQVAAVLALASGFMYPPLPFFIGFLEDLLYYPGHGVPFGFLFGFLAAVFCAVVRYFVRTRIM